MGHGVLDLPTPKVPTELVWPAGKVGPLGVCEWARCSSGQLPRRAGTQGPPIPISHSSWAHRSPEDLAGPGILKENLLEARVVVVFWEQQPPLPLVRSQPSLALDEEQDFRSGMENLPLIAEAASLPFSWCLLAGDVHSVG